MPHLQPLLNTRPKAKGGCFRPNREKHKSLSFVDTAHPKNNMFDFVLKGANASQLEKDIGSDLFPANEHFFGLVNVSNFLFISLYF